MNHYCRPWYSSTNRCCLKVKLGNTLIGIFFDRKLSLDESGIGKLMNEEVGGFDPVSPSVSWMCFDWTKSVVCIISTC